MGTSSRAGGQRSNTTSASGRKTRSATSTSHKGSRVEPSHITEQSRETREKKSAPRAAKKTAKKKS